MRGSRSPSWLWTRTCRPSCLSNPSSINPAVQVFVLLNLVTAIIVENALKSSQNDENEIVAEKERERLQALQPFSSNICLKWSKIDGNGVLTRNEFEEAFEDPEMAAKLRMLDLQCLKDEVVASSTSGACCNKCPK
mmetsp:Transcript_2317/g.4546  ORF Transcript_2317/g.4546 Transcript_2317/m.4546 type:complete len:136 (+) Transcript_2317:133-540(+)